MKAIFYYGDNAAWVIGLHISPPNYICNYTSPDPTRTRKLLFNQRELKTLVGAVERKGYTLVPIKLYWKKKSC